MSAEIARELLRDAARFERWSKHDMVEVDREVSAARAELARAKARAAFAIFASQLPIIGSDEGQNFQRLEKQNSPMQPTKTSGSEAAVEIELHG